MSIIADKLRDGREAQFLVELEFEGLTKRLAMKDLVVPCAAGDDLLFEGLIQDKKLNVGSKFNFSSFAYSPQNVQINMINQGRFQDEEVRRRLTGGVGRVYVWCPGLDWTDIESAGLIATGVFKKDSHNRDTYTFTITDQSDSKFKTLPGSTINANTWPNHRAAGGSGSVAGLPQAIVLGDWSRGIPLRCVDTSAYKYIACLGVPKSTDADFSGATENVYDNAGSVIAATNYTFYPAGIDGQANPVACFDFTSDQSANEPLTCSIRGLMDGSGSITGTIGTVIEHPADIVQYLLKHHSTFSGDEISLQTLKAMRAVMAGLKFATIINDQASSLDVYKRILKQCSYASISRAGRIGAVGLHTDAVSVVRMLRFGQVGKTVEMSQTPEALISNNVMVLYAWNPATRRYDGELSRNRNNSPLCKKSCEQYGERPLKTLRYNDVHDETTAGVLIDRYIGLHAFRHDICKRETTYGEAFDVLEGDGGLLTVAEGASANGQGWVDEPCILVDRQFNKNTITQRWWRVGTD